MKRWSFAIGLLLALLPAVSASAAGSPRITGIAGLSLYVRDLGAARSFYRDFLGYREETGASATRFWINERQSVELRLERAPATDRLIRVSFETSDADGLRRSLAARGIPVPPTVVKSESGVSFTLEDPDGHELAFVQPAPVRRVAGPSSEAISTTMKHVGVLVGALQSSLAFYRDVLGFSETWRGSRDGQVLNWVNLKVPDGDDYLELMLYKDLPAPTERGTAHHLCLFVPDIEAAKATLAIRAVKAGYARPLEIRTGVNRKRQLNLFDPDGTRAELMEPRTIDGVPTPSATAAPPR